MVYSGKVSKFYFTKRRNEMKIDEITSQNRRDFHAILICESCGETQVLNNGYDDDNYHRNVIPNIPCKSCGKKSPDNYRPLATKYNPWEVI